jgi:hypothetical protein
LAVLRCAGGRLTGRWNQDEQVIINRLTDYWQVGPAKRFNQRRHGRRVAYDQHRTAGSVLQSCEHGLYVRIRLLGIELDGSILSPSAAAMG